MKQSSMFRDIITEKRNNKIMKKNLSIYILAVFALSSVLYIIDDLVGGAPNIYSKLLGAFISVTVCFIVLYIKRKLY